MRRQQYLLFIGLGISLLGLAYLSFEVPRKNIFQYWLLIYGLFGLYALQLRWNSRIEGLPQYVYLWTGILLRLLPCLAFPLLSDDFFRYIWDGRLMVHGVNPFLATPRTLVEDPGRMAGLGLSEELFKGMNSPDFFTIYPPVLQGIFALAAGLFPSNVWASVLVMKGFILLAEIGSLFLLRRLLDAFNLPQKWLAWYAWNPLVISELLGNLHFEGLMIFFLLAMVWLLYKGKIWWSTLPFVLAICTKLLPLMFAPLLIRRLGWKKAFIYGLISGGGCLLLFLLILDEKTFSHIMDSVDLYFANFEFNASLWYLIREGFGHLSEGNLLEFIGKYLALASFVSIMIFAFLEKDPDFLSLPQSMMWVLAIYFLFASIVHPWYICTLAALASLSPWRFPFAWTFFLPLTYFTYRDFPYDENLMLVLFEYLGVFGILLWEWKNKRH